MLLPPCLSEARTKDPEIVSSLPSEVKKTHLCSFGKEVSATAAAGGSQVKEQEGKGGRRQQEGDTQRKGHYTERAVRRHRQ